MPTNVLGQIKSFLFMEAKMRLNKTLNVKKFDHFLVSVSEMTFSVHPMRIIPIDRCPNKQTPLIVACGCYIS
jgi:hypothetical protein